MEVTRVGIFSAQTEDSSLFSWEGGYWGHIVESSTLALALFVIDDESDTDNDSQCAVSQRPSATESLPLQEFVETLMDNLQQFLNITKKH